jgi:flagellin-like protein
MQFKKLLDDDDAVSPVIGVILMVAITVILAAVIGTFVLGLGDQVQQTSPTAQFSFDYDSGNNLLDVTHDGGDGITASQLTVVGDIDASVTNSDAHTSGDAWSADGYNPSSTITAGDSITLGIDSTVSNPEVSVIWNAEGGDRSSTLAEWEA